MNLKTVSLLKKELMKKKETLSSIQTQTRKLESETETELKDMVDRSDAEESWFNKERMSQHWKLELLQINSALQRIDAGTFGVCEECESEIPVKRLRVRPDAALCLYCQESAEREMTHTQRSSGIQLFH